ncbi:MAG: polysaccharide lyase family 7 protein, partial [Saprospiraceae bacterium]
MESNPEEMEPPPVAEVKPAIITWENWYLSVPVDRGNGKATSIGYQDIIEDKLTSEAAKYFYENEDGSYTMWTTFTGFTTSGLSQLGDKYCRTELREYWRGNQDTNDNWSMATGVHVLESTMQVDFVEG